MKNNVNKELIDLYKSEKLNKIKTMVSETKQYAQMITTENNNLK